MLLAALAGLAGLLPSPARAQEAYREPDYSKFPPESGPITLEVWSWVNGLDKAARLFEQAYPKIKVHVNNVGGGPAEYAKSLKAEVARVAETVKIAGIQPQ